MNTVIPQHEQAQLVRSNAKSVRDLFAERELFLFDSESGSESQGTNGWIAVDSDEFR